MYCEISLNITINVYACEKFPSGTTVFTPFVISVPGLQYCTNFRTLRVPMISCGSVTVAYTVNLVILYVYLYVLFPA